MNLSEINVLFSNNHTGGIRMKKVNVENDKFIQHYSTRIPWKDNDYTGRIDNNPRYNVAAQIIANIASARDWDFEEKNKGVSYLDLDRENIKSWVTENAAFMSNREISVNINHPYRKNNEKFKHYCETELVLEPYSFLLRPFAWTRKDNTIEKHKHHNFYFDLGKTELMLNWSSAWVSHGPSQKGIFDYFFSGIVPNKSLIFPYYKQVPFIEDNRRVIAGIGNLTGKVTLQKYDTDGTRDEYNYIWETNAGHSIRKDGEYGFLMPYHEIYDYLKSNPEFDVSTVTIFEPAGFRDEFSYATEWVSYDAVIDLLNQAKRALKNIVPLNLKNLSLDWINRQLEYVDRELKNVWNQRGIYPGLGSALSALGLSYGFDIAKYINTDENPLTEELKLYFTGDKEIGIDNLDNSLAEKEDEFLGLLQNKNKLDYFELLARMNLSRDQANFAWSRREQLGEKILDNPYLLYELTRKEKETIQISISQIDNAMFVNPLVDNKYPLKKPSKMRTAGDKRRFRAMVTYVLSIALNSGHTLLTFERIIEEINDLPLDQKTDFELEKIQALLDFLEEGDLYVDRENGYIKLVEYEDYKNLIVNVIDSGLNKDYPIKEDWRGIIDNKFGPIKKGIEEKDERARTEKADALKIMEASRISILLGRAGTGKTTALSLFASSKGIREGGVLALTPTGKSRVQLENHFREAGAEADFMTVAQFLVRSGGFSGTTMSYKLPNKASTSIAKTIIIDECSMLTEVMFAGVLKLIDSHAERIIFTGDPNQLPPIGGGRPFVDLISYMENYHKNKIGILTTEMRQGAGGDDVSFAQIFSNLDLTDKDVIHRIKNNSLDGRLKFIKYEDVNQLEKLFFENLTDVTGMKDLDDIDSFNKSLGAEINKYTNYPNSNDIENWQILTPTRFLGVGSYYFNEKIHNKYRQDIVDSWNKYPWSKNKPQSIQNIVFGDKIISNVNGERDYWDNGAGREYIANGEIGIMVSYPGHYGKSDKNKDWYKFRFSSFGTKVFSYRKQDFGGENADSKLELAYALTIHKSQGSSFGQTIVIINGKSSFISKELLYTAFSRQEDSLIILSDLSIEDLLLYSYDWYSDTKQRFTDLFEKPNIVQIEKNNQKKYFEKNLIHRTLRGEMVRSKSEVIVANLLDKMGVEYKYEEDLVLGERSFIPDFTLRYKGKLSYLEHLGMTNDYSYMKKWENKKAYYQEYGISENKGNLIITKDGMDGSFDTEKVECKIRKWMDSIV